MAELEDETLESAGEAQATAARFNPWWIVGVAVFVIAVVLGLRTLRPAKKPPDEASGELPA